MRGRKYDRTSSLIQIQVVSSNIISKASIAIGSEGCLVVPDPDQVSLLNAGPCITCKLLKQLSTTKDIGRLNVLRMNVEAVGMIEQLSDCLSTTTIGTCSKRNFCMPALLTPWKEQNIVKCGITGMELADPLKPTP